MSKIILTGDRPTGHLHVGHFVGSLQERVLLQDSGKFDELYFMIADAQALTDNAENPEKVRQNVLQVALDYLGVGIDPQKSIIFIQSLIPELFELTTYYMDLVTVARVQRNPTVKAEIQQKNFEASVPLGFFCYPVSQAADITAFHATHVPVGDAFSRPEHFAAFLPEYANLDELKAHYQRGGLGDMKIKRFLNEVLQSVLKPIRERREYWEARKPEVVEILKAGTARAEAKAAQTLAEVRAAMKINYFENDNLLK